MVTNYAVSICTLAVYCTLKYYIHGSLFFSKKNCRALYFRMLYARQSVFLQKYCRVLYFGMLYARQSVFLWKNAVHCILECYMHGSLLFYKNTAVYYILECYMYGSSIQFIVFKPLSYCFRSKSISVKEFFKYWKSQTEFSHKTLPCTKFRIPI